MIKDFSSDTLKTAYIALGSNLGERAENLNRSIREIDTIDGLAVKKVSPFIETLPLAGMDQPGYLNAVVEVATTLRAHELLEKTKKIEEQLGRVLSRKWDPRVIDLDILLFGDAVVDTAELKIPHPQMHLRNFVLQPMCEIAENAVHPVLGKTVAQLKKRLNGRDYYLDSTKPQLVTVAGVIGVGKTTLSRGLARCFQAETIHEDYDSNPYLPLVYNGREDLALDSELFFLDSSVSQLGKRCLCPGKIYLSDYVFEKTLIYAKFWLNSKLFEKYQEFYCKASEQVVEPGVVVYLDDSVENCLERIAKRGRPYEKDISKDLLRTLKNEYDLLYEKWDKCPVVRVSASDFDFRNEKDTAEFAKELSCYICSDSN